MSDLFTFKAIKPKKLKVEAFRLEILNALRKEGNLHRKKLKPTVSGWRGKKPKFESLIGLSARDASVLTGPTGDDFAVQKWVWTDKGTKPHKIRARNAPRLRFMINFIPSTKPGSFSSGAAASWPPWRSPFEVSHPGTDPRGWSEALAKSRKRPFQREMFAAMKRASSKAF
jgi:hypothetical protein